MSGACPLERLVRVDVMGVDLDLTLVDTRAATAHALEVVNAECGERIDVDAFVARIGLPMRDELARWMPVDRVEAALQVFRAGFLAGGLSRLEPTPGAVALGPAVRQRGGRLVVITSRVPRIAAACLSTCGIDADAVVGGLTGVEKAPAIRTHGVGVYVGDHPEDMAGARHADVAGIGVTTGAHSADQLRDAGAASVVDSLEEVVAVLQ